MTPDPKCCDEPMVHNSHTGEFECAAAYFALADAGFSEAVIELLDERDVGAELVGALTHWRESRRPDGGAS